MKKLTVKALVLLFLICSSALAGEGFVYTTLNTQTGSYVIPSYQMWAVGDGKPSKLTPSLRVALEVKIPARDVALVAGRRTVTVLFPLNSSRLTPTARMELASIPKGARVRITGYTCDLGTEAYNLALSVRRAEAVASYLEERGIMVLSITGRGECCPVKKDGKINRPASRRVEVEKD